MTDFSALRGILVDADLVALRNVDALDDDQRRDLATSIRTAGARLAPPGYRPRSLTADWTSRSLQR